jgi:hypothetical protein
VSPISREGEVVAGRSAYRRTPLAHAVKSEGMFFVSLCGRSGAMFFIQSEFDPESLYQGTTRRARNALGGWRETS